MVKSYCNDDKCDCSRVFINVMYNNDFIATLGYGWDELSFYEKWCRDKKMAVQVKGPIIEYGTKITKDSEKVLNFIKDVALKDYIFVERLKKHYKMFKEKKTHKNSFWQNPMPINKEQEIETLLLQARQLRNVEFNDIKAIVICDKILKIAPENRDAMLIKAGALVQLNKELEFLKLVKLIITKWSNHWEAYYLMGLFLFNLDGKQALFYLERSLNLDENFDNIVVYAQLSYFNGKHDYMNYLEKAKSIDKKRYDNYMKTVWTYDLN